MAGNKRKRRRGCKGKLAWDKEADAKARATKINKAQAREKMRTMKWLSPYRCRSCGKFHIGHRAQKPRAQRLNDLIDRAVAEDRKKGPTNAK